MAHNLRRLIEKAIKHGRTHQCEECARLADLLEGNIQGPFTTVCFRCEETMQTAKIHVGTSGEIICATCKELENGQ